ncbi:MAG: lipid-binding SYLF domain-containing protein [Synergistaceae bacterium]|nr:lipid-binding SYLF domain-containing protein [Synergistaceae bacterium]
MKKILVLASVMALVFAGTSFAASTPESIIHEAIAMLSEISTASDISSMAETVRTSHAIAIIPSMVKAGLIIGGEYGEGLILRHKDGKWYGPSFYNLGGGSFGLQLGAQKVSLLLAVVNERGVNAFVKDKVKLGGDIGVAAGPVGRRAEAATDAKAKASIYSYSMSKGLFAGVSLEGSVISISVKRNSEYWGGKVTASDALDKPANDKRILPLVEALDELIKKAK